VTILAAPAFLSLSDLSGLSTQKGRRGSIFSPSACVTAQAPRGRLCAAAQLGECGDWVSQRGALLGDDLVQRRGAALAFGYLKLDPLPGYARAAILDAIAADDLEKGFDGLPRNAIARRRAMAGIAAIFGSPRRPPSVMPGPVTFPAR
jgi:hypothetical protein